MMIRLGIPAIVIASMLAADCSPLLADDNGRVTHVTLYRSQALVTRTLQINGEAGVTEFVVGDLPEQIVADSLFAEGTEEVEVRAVQYRTRAVGESPREEVRAKQAEILANGDLVAMNQKNQEIAQRQLNYLDSLEGFVAPTATTELSQGVLDAEALERITKFSFEQRETISKRQVELAREARDLAEQQSLLQRQLGEMTNGATKTVREAVLYVSTTAATPQEIRLNYLVNGCGWSPTYTIRSENEQPTARIDYNGLIYQMSGEDWKDIAITLSTASPALSAAGPGLAPLRVTLQNGDQSMPQQGTLQSDVFDKSQIAQIVGKQKQAVLDNRNAIEYKAQSDSNWKINDAANQFACVTLFGNSEAVSELQTQFEDLADEPSLSYRLATTVTLPSRNSKQMIRIVSTELPGEFYFVATPVLTSFVYREAQLVNNSSEDLLGGPIMVYLDDKFVGRGEIATVARGQSFVVGFGADPQLRTRRELVEKTEGINGGNRELTFDYRMVVDNFKETEATVRILDRMPNPLDGAKIRITNNKFTDELSSDPFYQRTERPEGILRWDVSVAAKASGNEAKTIDYGFTVEYDRNYIVSLPDQLNQQKQDFERLQRGRTVR